MLLHNLYEFANEFEVFNKDVDYSNIHLEDEYHFHDECEIFMVLSGYVEYYVEAEVFTLGPKDFVIINSNLLHGKTATKSEKVSHVTIYVGEEFFQNNNCAAYKDVFMKSREKSQYKISKETCENSGFYNAYERLKKYSENFSDKTNPVVTNTITEMLHILNNYITFSKDRTIDTNVKKILNFINDNYTENVSLDEIASECYLSKSYMCKIFKEHTGYSVGKYIIQRKLEYVRNLVMNGKSITNACIEAGFSDYSSFYKAFFNEYNTSPKKFYNSFLK